MPLSRLEQHMASKYAAPRAFTAETIKKVQVSTGVSLAYVIQESEHAVEPSDEVRVVLVMGYSYRKEEWAPIVDGLLTLWAAKHADKKLKVLTFDNRGVGHSDAPWGKYSTTMMAKDTLALMDDIEWKTFHLVGTSMGGMISEELCLMAPERVQSLSLVVSARGKFTPALSTYPSILTTLTSSDSTKIVNAMLSFLYPKGFLESKNGDNGTMHDVVFKYHTEVAAANGAPPSSGALGQTAALVLHYVSDDKLRKIRDHGYPILIVGARQDLCIDVSHALHFKDVLASDHTEFVMYEDAGHAVFLQHMDEVADNLISTFLRA
jgi:pimeloyl-ACP methyl ester carboxylesterase